MIEISNQTAQQLINDKKNKTGSLGYVCEQGAIIGDAEFIIKQIDNKSFLLHKSEIEFNGCCYKEKTTNK